MVSKPTGRPRGRPRKSVASPARPVGRPPMPLADDPDRWALAFVERAIRATAAQGIKELRIIDTYVTWQLGVPVVDAANLDRLEPYRRGRPGFWVWMPESKHLAALKCSPAPWRYEHAFRPYIDDLRARLRRYRRRDDDARRLRIMADVWEICLRGNRIDKARRLAASIGEAEFFEEEMRPRHFPYAAPLMGCPIFP